jgi:hypothetical protein
MAVTLKYNGSSSLGGSRVGGAPTLGRALTYRHLRLLARASAIVLALALVAVPWFLALRGLIVAKPVSPSASIPRAVVWADRVFPSPPQLAAWLRSRGADYALWAQRHPDARDALEGASAADAPAPAKLTPAAKSAPRHARLSAGGSSYGKVVLLGIALLAAAIACVPRRVYQLRLLSWVTSPADVRWIAFFAALQAVAMLLLFSLLSS